MLPVTLFAQSTITGKVLNLTSKKGIPAASVFLSKTSVGNNTAEDGSFTLTNVKNGYYDLVVSCIGFETHHQNIEVNNASIKLQAIEMIPKSTQLQEVIIQFKNNPERDKLVKMFAAEFLGHTDNASQCKLINPEVLDVAFDKAGGNLVASSSDFLIIENNAMGYRIKYLLTQFFFNQVQRNFIYTGSYIFEPLTGTPEQVKSWEKKRVAAYLGSDMHFLRSCIENTVSEEGFTVQRLIRTMNTDRPADSIINLRIKKLRQAQTNLLDNIDSLRYWRDKLEMPQYTETLAEGQVNSSDYIKLTQKDGIYAFGYPDCLRINFKKKKLSTVVTFRKTFAPFDNNGVLFNPDCYTLEGYWGTQRVADLLPVDYKLPMAL